MGYENDYRTNARQKTTSIHALVERERERGERERRERERREREREREE